LRTPFSQRANEMGLDIQLHKLLFTYSDQYGEVVYRQLSTRQTYQPDLSGGHETDGLAVPIMAIYTKSPTQLGYQYCGYVSDFYQFIGNDVLNQEIRNAIQEVGIPILVENPIMSYDLTRMRNEIIIQSSQNIPEAGDIAPVIILENSYNGTKAASISFGIATYHNNDRVIFSFNLGEMRQVHIVNSNTQMSSVVSSYMEVFTEHITDMITESFQTQLTEHQMLSTLDVIEGIGKQRRKDVVKFLQELIPQSEGETPPLPSSWFMFLAIVRYSAFEPSLNIKRMLENVAESVLVIPTRMYEVLEKLQAS